VPFSIEFITVGCPSSPSVDDRVYRMSNKEDDQGENDMIVKAKGAKSVVKGSAVAVALGLAVLANPAMADQYTDAAKK
jgi:hypothetical protein